MKTTLCPQDIDFIRDAREAIRGDSVPGANLLLWLIMLVIAGFLFWASQAELDEVTKGEGKVIPSSSLQTVQNLEGGIIAEILVSEGDQVTQGEILARIDDTISSASYNEHLAEADALRAALARLEAEAHGLDSIAFPVELRAKRPDLIERETQLFEKRQAEVTENTGT
ncbi:MAG: biotin/lipoyl-binding protein, partial [Verrucomicrobiota bacterium]